MNNLGIHSIVKGPDISVIYVNWNSEDYLEESIVSLYKYTSAVSFEIIIVDNASATTKVLHIKERFPGISVIRNDINLGFARANNLGFKNSHGAYVLFLNPDTKLVTHSLDILCRYIKAAPSAGVFGCKLLNTDLSVQTSSIQKFPTILGAVMDLEYFRLRWPGYWLWNIAPLFTDAKEPVAVEMISGACMMLKREVFEEVGMFSEDYFMYAEDLDLCYRVKKCGYINYYIGESVIVHHGGKSSGKRGANHWATVMKYNAVTRFLTNTRGRLYGIMFRASMASVAALRLLVLSFFFLAGDSVRRKETLYPTLVKWIAVIRWSLYSRGLS